LRSLSTLITFVTKVEVDVTLIIVSGVGTKYLLRTTSILLLFPLRLLSSRSAITSSPRNLPPYLIG